METENSILWRALQGDPEDDNIAFDDWFERWYGALGINSIRYMQMFSAYKYALHRLRL